MLPFDSFPGGGRQLLGRPKAGSGSSRTGYGLSLQRMTGQSCCAYCGVDLTDNYYHWLLLTVDHVVPVGESVRLGISEDFYQDAINLVLACSGCNGFLNRYRCDGEPLSAWTLDQFVALRDKVFAHRFDLIRARREQEVRLFENKPWDPQLAGQPAPAPEQEPVPGSSAKPVDGLVIFTDNDAGYLAWLDANPAGFVVNTLRNPNPNNLVLHHTSCRTITGQPTRGSGWTGAYVKVCSTDVDALQDWARREVGGELRPCGICKPSEM